MSLATILTAVPAYHLVTNLSFQQNTMPPASLPCSSNLARCLFIYRAHLAPKSVCRAARRDRAGADSQWLCRQLWLPSCKLPGWAAVHSLAGHSCLRYLLRVASERKILSRTYEAHLPYTLQIFSKGTCKNYKLCIQTKRLPLRWLSIVPQSIRFFLLFFFSLSLCKAQLLRL